MHYSPVLPCMSHYVGGEMERCFICTAFVPRVLSLLYRAPLKCWEASWNFVIVIAMAVLVLHMVCTILVPQMRGPTNHRANYLGFWMQDLLVKWECILLASFSWIKATAASCNATDINWIWYYTPKLDSLLLPREEKMPLMDKIKETPRSKKQDSTKTRNSQDTLENQVVILIRWA